MTANRDENKEQANRAYEAMFEVAREWLLEKKPEEIAANSGARYEAESNSLILSTMGQEITIGIPEYRSQPVLENWQYLILLHYLKMADGTPLTGELITIKDLPDGLIRGTKFERTANTRFLRDLKGKSREDILAACQKLGGEEIQGRGDLSIMIPFLPYCPFYINFWMADEEFDANGKMFFDRSAARYLTIEDAVTVGEIVLNRLESLL